MNNWNLNLSTIIDFAKWIAKDEKMKVTVKGESCFFNEETGITIPETLNNASAMPALGCVIHEAGHKVAREEDKRAGFDLKDVLDKGEMDHYLLNWAEDMHIDRETVNLAGGAYITKKMNQWSIPTLKKLYKNNEIDPIHAYFTYCYASRFHRSLGAWMLVKLSENGYKEIDSKTARIITGGVAGLYYQVHELFTNYSYLRKSIKELERPNIKIRETVVRSTMDRIKRVLEELNNERKQNGQQPVHGNGGRRGAPSDGKDQRTDRAGDTTPGNGPGKDGDPQKGGKGDQRQANSLDELGAVLAKSAEAQRGAYHFGSDATQEKLSGHELVDPANISSGTKQAFLNTLMEKYNTPIECGSSLNTDELDAYFSGDIDRLFKEDKEKSRRKGRFYLLCDSSGSMGIQVAGYGPLKKDELAYRSTRHNLLRSVVETLANTIEEAKKEGAEIDCRIFQFNTKLFEIIREDLAKSYDRNGGTCLLTCLNELVDKVRNDCEVNEKMVVIMTDGNVRVEEIKEVEKMCLLLGDMKIVFVLIGDDKAMEALGDQDCLILFKEDADEVLFKQCQKLLS
jgi:hypothetical protein